MYNVESFRIETANHIIVQSTIWNFMSTIEEQQNNPLHGLKVESLLNELVDHYGWVILEAATNINCFKNRPSIEASLKFLRKNKWAQEKLENLYLYEYKRMPRPSDAQYELAPRERGFSSGLEPREPLVLTVEELLAKREIQQKKAQEFQAKGFKSKKSASSVHSNSRSSNSRRPNNKSRSNSSQQSTNKPVDPWAAYKKD